jgi:hypothetical protein
VAAKKKSAAKKSAAKKSAPKTSARRPAVRKVAKKSGAKKPAAKKSAPKTSAKRPAARKAIKKAAAKRPAKRIAAKKATLDATKVVIPPVPTRSTQTASPAAQVSVAKPTAAAASVPAKKSSSGVLFMVIAGVVLLAIFALANSSSDDDDAPKPVASESASEEPSAEPTETEAPALTYEAPTSFVAINNASGGVTLRWKAPAATEGLTGYLVSISYNAVDFKEVATVPADQLNLDIAKVGEEGGTQFFIQSVYEDGTKADGAKFALKGKYE